MMPLTKSVPKPLLQVGNKPLIQYHIEAMSAASVKDIVINTGRFGEKIEKLLGSGERFGVNIQYSHEGERPRGTGRGVQMAITKLGEAPFILINADIWTDYNFMSLPEDVTGLAHLVMVDNPSHNQSGDFALLDEMAIEEGQPMLTYSGIGVYHPEFFTQAEKTMVSFIPALKLAMKELKVSGEYYSGRWFDIGTPERLGQVETLIKNSV